MNTDYTLYMHEVKLGMTFKYNGSCSQVVGLPLRIESVDAWDILVQAIPHRRGGFRRILLFEPNPCVIVQTLSEIEKALYL